MSIFDNSYWQKFGALVKHNIYLENTQNIPKIEITSLENILR